MGSPFALGQHLGLVVLFDKGTLPAAVFVAADHSSPAVVLGPLEVLPLQVLVLAAVRARHVVVALIALLKQVSDARGTLNRWRAGKVELGVAAKGGTAGLGQLDRVAFVLNVNVPAVHLIAVHIPGRYFRQVGSGACRGDVQRAAFKFLCVHRVARVT